MLGAKQAPGASLIRRRQLLQCWGTGTRDTTPDDNFFLPVGHVTKLAD